MKRSTQWTQFSIETYYTITHIYNLTNFPTTANRDIWKIIKKKGTNQFSKIVTPDNSILRHD